MPIWCDCLTKKIQFRNFVHCFSLVVYRFPSWNEKLHAPNGKATKVRDFFLFFGFGGKVARGRGLNEWKKEEILFSKINKIKYRARQIEIPQLTPGSFLIFIF